MLVIACWYQRFALVEFEDLEEAGHAFSMIDGISFKELKISAQFDRSSICTFEAFYRNQGDRQSQWKC